MAAMIPALQRVLAMPWIHWSVGGAVAAFGVGLLYWSLLADRARGRRRCPRCWYDMRGSAGLRCPECGHAPRSARGLLRTRRRWRIAALALFFFVGGTSIALIPKIQRDGWLSLVPTTVLLFAHPATPDWTDQHPVLVELDRRSAAANLAAWQWRYLFENKGWKGQIELSPGDVWVEGRDPTDKLPRPRSDH